MNIMRSIKHFSHVLGLLFVGVMAMSAPAAAQSDTAKQAARDRHEKFEDLGTAFENIEKEAKKSTPDSAKVQRYAAEIETSGKDSINWFPAGSGPGNGFKTKAKAEVWSKPTEFQDLHDKFIAEATKLNQIAATADKAALAVQVHATGEACSECHEHFRKQGGLLSIFGGD
jgi:cytochrome c556